MPCIPAEFFLEEKLLISGSNGFIVVTRDGSAALIFPEMFVLKNPHVRHAEHTIDSSENEHRR